MDSPGWLLGCRPFLAVGPGMVWLGCTGLESYSFGRDGRAGCSSVQSVCWGVAEAGGLSLGICESLLVTTFPGVLRIPVVNHSVGGLLVGGAGHILLFLPSPHR